VSFHLTGLLSLDTAAGAPKISLKFYLERSIFLGAVQENKSAHFHIHRSPADMSCQFKWLLNWHTHRTYAAGLSKPFCILPRPYLGRMLMSCLVTLCHFVSMHAV